MSDSAYRASDQPAAPPPVSPDGRFWWSGEAWVPFPQMTATASAPTSADVAEGVAAGIFKFILILMVGAVGLFVLIAVLSQFG